MSQESMPRRAGSCEVVGPVRPGFETVLTPAALDFVAELTREFGGRVAELLARREVRQAQIDAGDRQGVSSSESERIRKLERENRELREANAILRDAAVFFAGELDPRRR